MLEQEACVVALNGTIATVEVQSQSACSSCEAKSGCGTGSLSRVLGRKPIQLDVDNHLQLQIGDKVVVGLEERALLLGSFLVYLFPLLLLFVAAATGQYFSQAWGLEGEWLTILSGVEGLVVGLLLVRNFVEHSKGNAISKPMLLRRQHPELFRR